MTLYFKFKSGKRAEITAVDDVDHDGDYICVHGEQWTVHPDYE